MQKAHKIRGELINVEDRKYDAQNYRINVWAPSGKVDLYMDDEFESVGLKFSEREAEELIDRLRFALMQAREARDG